MKFSAMVQSKLFWYGVIIFSILCFIAFVTVNESISDSKENYEKIDNIKFTDRDKYNLECMRLSGRPCQIPSK